MSENDMILRIKELMKRLNVNSGQFADMIGMDKSGFSKRINGHVAIGQGVINKIVLALSVNKDWLLLGEEPMIKPHEYTGTVPQEQKSPDHPSEEMIRAQIENKLLREQLAELKEELRKAMEKNAELKYRRDNHL